MGAAVPPALERRRPRLHLSEKKSPAKAGLPGFVPLWSSSSPVSNRQMMFSASLWGSGLNLSSYRAWSGRFFTNWTGWVHSRCPFASASGLPTAAFPLYILRMNYSSPLLSLMCGGFLVFVFLFSVLIYIGGKALKNEKTPRWSAGEVASQETGGGLGSGSARSGLWTTLGLFSQGLPGASPDNR